MGVRAAAAAAAPAAAALAPAPSSRRAFVARATTACATTGAALASFADGAAAAPKPKKQLLRGGKNASDALHNGTDLSGKEAAAAGGLLEKMGLPDITPDKGPSARAPPSSPRSR